MARDALRYYAYSPQMGRRRVPAELTTETEVIDWAAGRGALNVVREDGPASKPHGVHVIWQKDAPTDYDIRLKISDVLAEHFPNATVREIGNAMNALMQVIR